MLYCTQKDVEAVLQRELTSYEQTQIEGMIEIISGDVSAYLNRNYNSVSGEEEIEVTERLYDGDGGADLYIDDVTEIEEIEIEGGGTIDDADNYLLYPLNGTVKERIRLKNKVFSYGEGNIIVRGKFNSGDCPKGVTLITASLCARFLQSTANAGKQFKKESIEGYSYEVFSTAEIDSANEDLLMRLDSYKKLSL